MLSVSQNNWAEINTVGDYENAKDLFKELNKYMDLNKKPKPNLEDVFSSTLKKNINSAKIVLTCVSVMIKRNIYFLTKIFHNKKNIIFYVDTPMMFLHIDPIWKILRQYSDKIDMYFVVGDEGIDTTLSLLMDREIRKDKIISIDKMNEVYFADLFISPTQWCTPPKGKQLNIQIFHGLSSKGISFPDTILGFDVLFLPNSIFKDLYTNNFIKKHLNCKNHTLYEMGYPKLDDLYNREYNRDEIFKKLNLDSNKITIMYAPTFLKEGSLLKQGTEIIKTVLDMDVNLLVKLHPESYNRNIELTGGIDWKKELNYYEKHKNFRNILDLDSNPYLFISDILITDISSIAYEFMFLDRPIIYVDVPELFEKSLVRIYHFSKEEAKQAYYDPRCNTGRDVGLLIKSVNELKSAINECIKDPMKNSSKRKELMKNLLYNPGKAGEKSAEIILKLLDINIL